MNRGAQAGFTLIETLVALSVLGVTAAFVLSATERHTTQTIALSERMLALWVAENRLVRLEAGRRDLPPIVRLAGLEWQVGTALSETPDPDLRRVEVTVAAPRDPQGVLARLTGFLDANGGGL